MRTFFQIGVCLVLFGVFGCSKGGKCHNTAEQHCSRFSDVELKDIWGGVEEGNRRDSCVRGYAANCEAERKNGGNIPNDAVIAPNAPQE